MWEMECPEVFYTFEWALAVSRAYRDSITPLLILAYEQDSLVGVAALATDEAQSRDVFSWRARQRITVIWFPVLNCGRNW